MGFIVQQSCPQCGAPIDLDEEDRLIECPYCEAKSIMCPSDYFRYVMHHNAPGKEIIYAPYLRFKGAVYMVQVVPERLKPLMSFDVDYRVVDISSLSTTLSPLRTSLGVRTQTVKASFPTPETGGMFLNMIINSDEIIAKAANLPVMKSDSLLLPPTPEFKPDLNRMKKRKTGLLGSLISGVAEEFLDLDSGDLSGDNSHNYFSQSSQQTASPDELEVVHHEIIGEALSIVYLPLYVEGDTLFDAIVNEPVGKLKPEDAEVLFSASLDPKWQVNFVPMLCPQCGWDLKGSRNSIVFTCDNCHTAWETSGGKLRRTKLRSVPGQTENASYLPFWRINATCPSLNIESYIDLIKMEKPLASTEEYEGKELSFIIPAFKTSPKLFMDTAERFTFTQHVLPSESNECEVTCVSSVILPLDEAKQAIKLILASRSSKSSGSGEKYAWGKNMNNKKELPEAKVNITDSALIYLPFNESGYELSAQYGIQVSIIKRSLELVSDVQKPAPPVDTLKPTIMCPLCDKEVPGGSMRCPYCGIGL